MNGGDPLTTSVGRRRSAAAALCGWPGAVALIAAAAGVAATVWSGLADGISADSGGTVTTAAVTAAVLLVAGVARRPRRWWSTRGISIVAGSAALAFAGRWWIEATGLVAEHYPLSFLLWTGLALSAVGVAVAGGPSGAIAVRTVRILAAPAAVLAAFLLINDHYGYYPTVGAVMGHPIEGQVSAAMARHRLVRPPTPAVDTDRVLSNRPTGVFAPVAIPASPVAFPAARAWVWLPPAYFSTPRPVLPVLVMLTGIPGRASDWAVAGGAVPVADRWARTHGGTAPVMIFVDENGRGDRDTECVNGPQGAAASYLTTDLARWTDQVLGITSEPGAWGAVGFSEGGTCALGLGIEDPAQYRAFVDISGDRGPNLGNPAETRRVLFGGDAALARSFDPTAILAGHHYSDLAGWVVVGVGDQDGRAAARTLAPRIVSAGVRLSLDQARGGHTWAFARRSFAHIYPSLVADLDRSLATGAHRSPTALHGGAPAPPADVIPEARRSI
jgi:Putative esterase